MAFEPRKDQVTHSAEVEVIQPLPAPDLNRAVSKATAEKVWAENVISIKIHVYAYT